MKINFSTVLKNLDGEPLVQTKTRIDKDGKKEKYDEVLTLQSTIFLILLQPVKVEEDGDVKAARYELARYLKQSPLHETELKTEDVVLLKELVGKRCSEPLIVGQVYRLLEGKDV